MLTLIVALLAASPAHCPPSKPCPVELPRGKGGIGFDDLGYAPKLGKLLVPAGWTGSLDLVDPRSLAVTQVPGFSIAPGFGGGHEQGVTSADEGPGVLFATDRTRHWVSVVEPGPRGIRSHALLQYEPDYVRWVAPLGQVWVTEPGHELIEMFRFVPGAGRIDRLLPMRVPGGPESLVIDPSRNRAYANLWEGTTVAIDLTRHQVVARWQNGCEGSRGLAIDRARGWLFVGCAEGGASVLSLADGHRLSRLRSGDGVDIIAYSETLRHLYVPGAKSATLAVMSVSEKGKLRLERTVRTVRGAHCVAVAPPGRVAVCDPRRGRLLVFDDR